MAYKADIQLAVKGLNELKNLNLNLDRNGKAIDRSNEKLLKFSSFVSSRFVPSVQNFSAALQKANENLNKSALNSDQARKAARNLVRAENEVNDVLQQRAALIEKARGKTPGLGNEFTTSSSPFQSSRDALGRTAEEQNAILDERAKKITEINKKNKEEFALVQKALAPKIKGTKIQQEENKQINETLNLRAKELMEIRKTTRAQDRRLKIEQKLGMGRRGRFGLNRIVHNARGRGRSAMQARENAASNALIGGAFPLLFGQGAGASAGGALGGAAGGLLGGQFGFALSLVGTQLGSLVDNLVSSTAALGRAIGPFARDTEAVTASLGLQGSVEEARLKLIEQAQGKTAAFNAAMKIMNQRIGERGVKALKQFGENARLLGSQFTLALTKLQAFTAGIANFIIRITGLQKSLEEGEATKIVSAAAAGGDSTAIGLVARRNQITSIRGQGGEGSRKKVLLDQLKIEEQIFAIQQKVATEVAELTTKSSTLLADKQKEVDLNKRVAEIMKTGVNKELAKSLAEVEQIFDEEQKILLEKQKQTKAAFEKAIIETNDKDLQRELQIKYDEITKQLDQHNIEREKGIKLTKDLGDGTDKVAEAFKRLNETIRNDIKEGIKGLIKGTSTLGDLLNNVADRFLDLALNQALFGNASGEFSKGSGIFGAIAGIFKANGGPVRSGKSFIVGEKGPELFTPGRSGAITPNNKLMSGGSTSVVVNVDASGTDVQGDEAEAKQLGTLISVAVQGELLKQQRPGGLLANTR